jgi:hypothetical protein
MFNNANDVKGSDKETEKVVTTELRPFLRANGWNYYMSLKCRADEKADIYNVIESMEFKLVISSEREGFEMAEIFESSEWVYLNVILKELNGFDYYEGTLDIYELTEAGYLGLSLSNCLSEEFDGDEEDNKEQIDELKCDMIDNIPGHGDFDILTKEAVVKYIKTYF